MNLLSLKNRTPLQRLLALSAMYAGPGLVEETATGNPLVFSTSLSRPLKSLEIPFTPKQEGAGDPSPSNVRNIVPWDGLNLWNGGKNLFNKDTTSTGVWWKGNVLTGGSYANYKASDKIPVLPNVQYVLTRQSTQQGAVCYFDKDKQYVDQQTWDRYTPSRVIPDGVYYVSFTVEAEYIDSAQFEVGQAATAYEPYAPVTETDIAFPSPVYGGTLDAVTGVLTVEYEGHTSTWGEMITLIDREQGGYREGRIIFEREIPVSGQAGATSVNQRCDKAKYQWDDFNGTSHFYTAVQNGSYQFRVYLPSDTTSETEVTAMCKLKEPYTIQLTPQQITALIGNNTIWSDANGDMSAVYFNKG